MFQLPRWQARELAAAHAEGLHLDSKREGCPDCEGRELSSYPEIIENSTEDNATALLYTLRKLVVNHPVEIRREAVKRLAEGFGFTVAEPAYETTIAPNWNVDNLARYIAQYGGTVTQDDEGFIGIETDLQRQSDDSLKKTDR